MFAAPCFPALWFVVDLFSTKCASDGLFYFDPVRGDFPWRLIRESTKTDSRVERFGEEVQLASLLYWVLKLGSRPGKGRGLPTTASRQEVYTVQLGAIAPPSNNSAWLLLSAAPLKS